MERIKQNGDPSSMMQRDDEYTHWEGEKLEREIHSSRYSLIMALRRNTRDSIVKSNSQGEKSWQPTRIDEAR